jgi:hypothetical protein
VLASGAGVGVESGAGVAFGSGAGVALGSGAGAGVAVESGAGVALESGAGVAVGSGAGAGAVDGSGAAAGVAVTAELSPLESSAGAGGATTNSVNIAIANPSTSRNRENQMRSLIAVL